MIQEFAYALSRRRRPRREAVENAHRYATLLALLLAGDAVALGAGAEALCPRTPRRTDEGLRHVAPGSESFERLLAA